MLGFLKIPLSSRLYEDSTYHIYEDMFSNKIYIIEIIFSQIIKVKITL